MIRKTSLLLALLFINLLAFAQSEREANAKVARDYIAAYSNWDYETMSTFYHDSVKFHDPTAEVSFANVNYRHSGKEAVKGFFKGIFNNGQPEFVKLKTKETFSSANFFIFHSDWQCVLPGAWFGEGVTESVFVSIPLDTIIEIKDGKVYSHTDYGDYTTYGEQIQAQMNKK